MIYVIAANKRIADMVARGKGARASRDYTYVHDWSHLMGLGSGTEVYIYWGGTMTSLVRHRVIENYETAMRRGLNLIEVVEAELVP